jgi:hypothetical protein
MRIRFAVRKGSIRGLQVTARYRCSDGSGTFDRSDPLGQLGPNLEDIGPFPPIALRRSGLRQALETPSESAIYEVSGSYRNGAWKGEFRAIEGWGIVGQRRDPNGRIINEIGVDPDGGFLCDTGLLRFEASRTSG